MNDRPSAVELLEAVGRFLREDAVGALEGAARYQARVAANVVAIVAREIETEEAQLEGEWRRLEVLLRGAGEEKREPPSGGRHALRCGVRERCDQLVARIRAGDADAGPWRAAVLEHLARTTADKLAVAAPRRSDVRG